MKIYSKPKYNFLPIYQVSLKINYFWENLVSMDTTLQLKAPRNIAKSVGETQVIHTDIFI